MLSTFREHNARETACGGGLDPDERATLVALLAKVADAGHNDWVHRPG